MQYNELVTDANGTFTGTLTAPTAPQTVWVETLCDRDGTCSDDFGAPGSPFRCEYYPLATMRRIDFVTELPTTTTTVTTTPSQIPPTL